MIKVDTSYPRDIKRASKKKATSAGTDTSFSTIMDSFGAADTTEQSAAPQEAAPVNSLDVILSAQSVPEDITRRQHNIKQAHLTLDMLETLRNAMLIGAVPNYLLHDIERRMTEMRNDSDDPLLNDIIEDIELRAAVELAKFRMQR